MCKSLTAVLSRMVCDSMCRNPTLYGFPFQNGFRDSHFFPLFPEVDRIIYLDDLNSFAKISEVIWLDVLRLRSIWVGLRVQLM